MRVCRALTALIVGFIASAASAGPASEAVEKGRALAERMCAVCHMSPGQGEKLGPRGIPSFRAVANRPSQRTETVITWLRSVPPMMPDHHLTQDEIEILAEFIMSLRTAK